MTCAECHEPILSTETPHAFHEVGCLRGLGREDVSCQCDGEVHERHCWGCSPCGLCGGRGWMRPWWDGGSLSTRWISCPWCAGRGWKGGTARPGPGQLGLFEVNGKDAGAPSVANAKVGQK